MLFRRPLLRLSAALGSALAAALAGLAAPGCTRSFGAPAPPAGAGAPAAAPGLFRSVAAETGLHFRWTAGGRSPLNIVETLGHGCAFLDYDRDGYLDVFLVGNRRCALFRSQQGKGFRDVSHEAGLTAEGHFYGVAVGDYDNDGDPDVYVTGYGRCLLLRNNGRGAFEDVTEQEAVGARGPYDVVTAAAFADLNGDGRLDLIAGRYVEFTPKSIHFCTYNGVRAGCGVKNYDPVPPRVYANRGGAFQDVTREWGFTSLHGRCLGLAVRGADRGPGAVFYSANDEVAGDYMVPSFAAGRVRFANRGVSSGTAYNHDGLTQGGMGVDWGDYNNDGLPDLVVTTFQNEPNSLYRNDGADLFTEEGGAMGIAAGTTAYVGWTARFLDYDSDGWLDLLMTNGHSNDNAHEIDRGRSYPQPIMLYRNEAGSHFRDVTAEGGEALRKWIVGRGGAFGDYDNDGRIDALLVDEEGPALLLHNEAPPKRWIGLRLIGRRGNRDAVGARATVTAGGKTLTRDVNMAGGYLSAHDPRLLFGLGDATSVEKVVIRWPDGRTQTARNLRVDAYHEITEQ